ncbi:MAG: response regulator [Methanococcaceae archaeon]
MKKILIIEDSVDIASSINDLLQEFNYEVAVAINGEQAIEAARITQPDLIFCDVLMPRMNGFEVLKMLKAGEQTKHIPFVFLSAVAEKEMIQKGLRAGALNYIIKPFKISELLSLIDEVFNKFESAS